MSCMSNRAPIGANDAQTSCMSNRTPTGSTTKHPGMSCTKWYFEVGPKSGSRAKTQLNELHKQQVIEHQWDREQKPQSYQPYIWVNTNICMNCMSNYLIDTNRGQEQKHICMSCVYELIGQQQRSTTQKHSPELHELMGVKNEKHSCRSFMK